MKIKIKPKQSVYIIYNGKLTRAYVQAALYSHPDNNMPLVCWPRCYEWAAGWSYHLDTYGWWHESNVFVTQEEAVKSVFA